MKKITILLFLLITNILVAQVWTTGVVNLDTDYTVKFDIDQGSGVVTMTMVGPDNVWLGVGPGISTGLGMGNLGDDAIVYNSVGLQDRNMPSGTGMPNLDASQDWTLVSNAASGGIITVIATRAINTGDSNDFVFPTSAQALPILWAHGNGTTSFGYHGGGNRGGTVVNITSLGVSDFEITARNVSIYPNPSASIMNVSVSALTDKTLKLEVFDILGKRVYLETLNSSSSEVDVSKWTSGLFLVRLTSLDKRVSVTKRFVKI